MLISRSATVIFFFGFTCIWAQGDCFEDTYTITEANEILIKSGNTATGSVDINPPAVALDSMVLIPGGTFKMGDTFGEGSSEEKPVHPVTISSFYLSRTELTFEQYDRFCAETAREQASDGKWGRANFPVVNVTWHDAVAYCNWLSEQVKLTPVYTIEGELVTANWSANGFRLPTEAEWEYAARSGGREHRFGNGKAIANTSEINFRGSPRSIRLYAERGVDRRGTVVVDSLSSNELGLLNMSGNVWEWCWDLYESSYYQVSTNENPRGPRSGTFRVIRGGCWRSGIKQCSASARNSADPKKKHTAINIFGFRLARNA